MILSSKPKSVNFRIVLNNVEITSIKSLQKFFDFERFLVNDQMQFIRCLKWIDKKKGSQKGDQIESIVKDSREDVINNVAIPLIMGIIYETSFSDMIQFVEFLYGLNKNDYDRAQKNFSHFISNHGDKLHILFPIENIRRGNNILDIFFSNLDSSPETSSYLSQIYYRLGNLDVSQTECPLLWKLNNTERKTIGSITRGSHVIPSENLSIIGTEFIFLCAIAYLTFYQEDDTLHSLSDLIDKKNEYKPLRDRIGGSLKKLINEKDRDCYQICERLGYTTPQEKDPLFNEKLFLSSFFADDLMHDKLLSAIQKKNYYYPALFVIDSGRYESRILQSQQKVPYNWFRYILDYYDNPMGLDGDYDKEDEEDVVDELVILVHQRSEFPSIMEEYFCDPNELNQSQEVLYRRERIKKLQSGKSNYHHVLVKKREREYLNLSKEVIYMCEHMSKYINNQTGEFTKQCNTLIKKYRKDGDPLQREKLFVVAILLLIKDHNKNRINIDEKEILKLKNTYIPMEALFRINKLSENDKLILNPSSELLHTDWRVYFSRHMDSFTYRCNHYTRILKRWIANIVYYI